MGLFKREKKTEGVKDLEYEVEEASQQDMLTKKLIKVKKDRYIPLGSQVIYCELEGNRYFLNQGALNGSQNWNDQKDGLFGQFLSQGEKKEVMEDRLKEGKLVLRGNKHLIVVPIELIKKIYVQPSRYRV